MNTKRILIFIFLACQPLVATNTWASTYYVDKNPGKTCSGNYSIANRQCNGSDGTSYTTLQSAVNAVKAGDSVMVRAGTYNEGINMKASGQAGSEILFKNYNSESAVVNAKQSQNYAIDWNGTHNYIIWDGIEVTGGGRGGLYVRGNYNIIQNCKAHDNNNTVDAEILINQGDYNIVRHNEVYNGQNGIMIQDCNYSTVEYNFVHDCPGHTGIDYLPISTRNPQILWSGNNARYNIVARCNRGIYSRYQQNNEYVNNVIYNNILTGINFTVHPSGYQPTVYKGYTKVYNNTIFGNSTQGIDLVGTQYITIKNNIITNNTKQGIRADSSSNTGLVIDYNLYYGNATTYAGIASSDIGSHEKTGNPLYTDSLKGDFSLSSDKSPAYDAGVNLSSAGVTTDILGTSRPQGNGFDIGAYEYTSGVTTTTPPPTTTTPPPTTTTTTTTTTEVIPSSVLLVKADSGTLTAPMQVVSSADAPGGSYIITTTSNSGSAVYNVNIDQTGKYKLVADVYAPDASSDSFFVKVDNGTEHIWDLNPTGDATQYNVWRQDEVTARGTGTFDAPQFDPLILNLTAGTHTVTFNGRDSNTRLAYFYFEMIPATTPIIEAESGVLTSPMQAVSSAEASGGAYIATTTSNAGSAVYTFNIDQPGTYKIIAEVYAPDASSDSFFVKVDNGTEHIWDLNPTGDATQYNVWRQDEVTARGTGTYDAPQFDPLVLTLAAGSHTITFSGRNPNTRLDNFYLLQISNIPAIIKIQIK